jgi:hypothetical protein
VFEDAATVRDQIRKNVHAIDSARISAATQANIDARIEESMNAAALEVWLLRDWTFRYVGAALTLLAADGNNQALPAETAWVNEGKQGGIWRVGEPKGRMTWRPLQVVNNLVLTRPDEQGPPLFYAVSQATLVVWPKPAQNFAVAIMALVSMPVIDGSQSAPADGLSMFSQAARYVVYLGAAAEESRRKGDLADYSVWSKKFEAAKFDLVISEHQGLQESGDMPRYAGSADVFPNLDE